MDAGCEGAPNSHLRVCQLGKHANVLDGQESQLEQEWTGIAGSIALRSSRICSLREAITSSVCAGRAWKSRCSHSRTAMLDGWRVGGVEE